MTSSWVRNPHGPRSPAVRVPAACGGGARGTVQRSAARPPAVPAAVQAKGAPGRPVVPAPSGGRVGPGAVQAKTAAPGTIAVPAACGGAAAPVVQPKGVGGMRAAVARAQAALSAAQQAPGSTRGPATGGRGAVVQRMMSYEDFVEATTTTSWCCRPSRINHAAVTAIDRLLQTYEERTARGLAALEEDDLLNEIQMVIRRWGSAGGALGTALTSLNDEINRRKDTIAAAADAARAEIAAREARAAAERAAQAEAENLQRVQALGWDDRIDAFKRALGIHGNIVETLVEGIDARTADDAALARLCRNFANIRFTYSMTNRTARALLRGEIDNGDCHTLADVMSLIAHNVLGVATRVRSKSNFAVNARTRTIDGARAPNGAGGAFWTFDNHYWVEYGGRAYDPLFAAPLDRSEWKDRRANTRVEGIDVEVFDTIGALVGLAEWKRIDDVTQEDLNRYCATIHKDPVPNIDAFKRAVAAVR